MLNNLKVVLATAIASSITPLAGESVSCSFCNEQILQNQKVYEDNHVMVLVDYKPVIDGHCLIVPKRHVSRLEDLSDSELLHARSAITKLFEVSQKVQGATGYLIFQKNGKEAGQSVPHVHFHFFPRKEGDYTDLGIYARMFFLKFKSPLSQEELFIKRDSLSLLFQESPEDIQTQEAINLAG